MSDRFQTNFTCVLSDGIMSMSILVHCNNNYDKTKHDTHHTNVVWGMQGPSAIRYRRLLGTAGSGACAFLQQHTHTIVPSSETFLTLSDLQLTHFHEMVSDAARLQTIE